MPAQEPGCVEGPEERPAADADVGGSAAAPRYSGLITPEQVGALGNALMDAAGGMLSMQQALGAYAQERASSQAQEGVSVRDDYARRDAADAEVHVPRKRSAPTGEGYCRHCHFVVGTYRRRLIRHAGYWAMWKGGAVHKSPENDVLSAKNVQWCAGSGKLPSPNPVNMIDPWENDLKPESSS